jgi:hypothetical protein
VIVTGNAAWDATCDGDEPDGTGDPLRAQPDASRTSDKATPRRERYHPTIVSFRAKDDGSFAPEQVS